MQLVSLCKNMFDALQLSYKQEEGRDRETKGPIRARCGAAPLPKWAGQGGVNIQMTHLFSSTHIFENRQSFGFKFCDTILHDKNSLHTKFEHERCCVARAMAVTTFSGQGGVKDCIYLDVDDLEASH